MVPEVSSLLKLQVSQCVDSGAIDEAMARMRRYLELEREVKKSALHKSFDQFTNLRKLPVMKCV